MERNFGRQLFLKQVETLQSTTIIARDIYQEIIVVESLELDFDICGLHYFIDFTVLLATDKFTMLIREFNLEADFVME